MRKGVSFFLMSLALVSVDCLALMDRTEPWPCSTDGDCPSETICDSARFVCVPKGNCHSSDDCDGGYDCLNGQCVAWQCSMQDDPICGYYQCDMSVHHCHASCDAPGDCAGDGACVESECVAAECGAEGEQDPCNGYICLGKLCLSECSTSYECTGNLECVESRCSCDPASPAQCNGFACENSRCLTSCSSVGGCAEGYTCTDIDKCTLKLF